MVASKGIRPLVTRINIVLANTRRVVDPGCGGDLWGGGDCKTSPYIIEWCLSKPRESFTITFMSRVDGNSFIGIAQRFEDTVSSKQGDDYLCGSLVGLVMALCIIIIGTCTLEKGSEQRKLVINCATNVATRI